MKKALSCILCLMLLAASLPALAEPSVTQTNAEAAQGMSQEEFFRGNGVQAAEDGPGAFEPFAPEGLTKTILGSDDRVYNDPTAYPYSAVAGLYVHYSCCGKWLNPSGFMAGPNLLVTAAHCMVCMDHGGTVDRLEAYFGFRNTKNYLYHFTGSTRYWYGAGFRQSDGSMGYSWEDQQRDYAYVILSERVGDVTGWFGLTALNDDELNGKWLTVTAYKDWKLQTSSGTATVYNENTVSHQADTLPGYSGGPLYDNSYYAVAINVASGDDSNFGRRFTQELFSEMRQNGAFDFN